MDAVRTVEAEVRELVRRSGVDPARDPKAVQRLVRDAVADYDQRSMHGGMPVLSDVTQAEKSVWDTVAGFGPLQQYFDDPTVEEIWIKDRVPAGFSRSAGSTQRAGTGCVFSDKERGDVPGGVLVCLMAAGLFAVAMTMAENQIDSVLAWAARLIPW
ncbi:hypothetical protein [Knoellia flava]|uniref:Uncharacterized protein n=1 Tax=Knoellia flava TaxID=913969 RepID=A0A8H9FQJ8_9MICO|nr:hypothetical protein [Knoellia flava]GGB71553.1 hypothetical protein GCM10011314_08660 [Knoellia flava]